MRKKFVTNEKEIEEIILTAQTCYLAMVDENNLPYVVPMNFGFQNGTFYLHSGLPGKKMSILQKNNHICLALDIDSKLHVVSENTACSYSMKYKSVIAHGKIKFIENYDEKVEGMNIIMKHYIDKEFTYNKPAIDNVAVFTLKPTEITAINRGYC